MVLWQQCPGDFPLKHETHHSPHIHRVSLHTHQVASGYGGLALPWGWQWHSTCANHTTSTTVHTLKISVRRSHFNSSVINIHMWWTSVGMSVIWLHRCVKTKTRMQSAHSKTNMSWEWERLRGFANDRMCSFGQKSCKNLSTVQPKTNRNSEATRIRTEDYLSSINTKSVYKNTHIYKCCSEGFTLPTQCLLWSKTFLFTTFCQIETVCWAKQKSVIFCAMTNP